VTAFTGRLKIERLAYPLEFRARAIALVCAGKPQKQAAHKLDIHPVMLSKWGKQDRIYRGEIPGVSTTESLHHHLSTRHLRDDVKFLRMSPSQSS
jgi:transposase